MSRFKEEFVKPLLRGHFHQEAFYFALGASLMLIAKASSILGYISAVIYTLTLINMLGTSALYHRIQWNLQQRQFMRRLDHSAIFTLIAGTATPIALLALPQSIGYRILVIFWSAALLGILKTLLWINAPKWVSAVLYVAMGWVVIPYLPEFAANLGQTSLSFLVTGGVIYTLGAVIYALKSPNPFPKVFGYHEIFHLFVIIAAIFHFLVVYQLIH